MTDLPAAPADAPTPLPDAAVDDVPWQPLPLAARRVARLSGALVGLLPLLPLWGVFVFRVFDGWGARIAAAVAVAGLGAAIGAWLAQRRWAATSWRLDARGLQVRRGRMFRQEILVPRSRVQHLDLERGPIERRHGLATIVVHTAGSRLHALRQAGLAEADAVALRDALVPDTEGDGDAV